MAHVSQLTQPRIIRWRDVLGSRDPRAQARLVHPGVVVVERSIRYVSHPARLPGMERSPLNHAALYFEKIGQLHQPGHRHAAQC